MWMLNDYDADIQYLFDYINFGQSLCFLNVAPENQQSDVTFIKSHRK